MRDCCSTLALPLNSASRKQVSRSRWPGFLPAIVALFCLGITTGASAAPAGAPAASVKPAALPPKQDFHLFLLLGQSNMAGRGTVTPQDQVPHPRVLMLNKAGEWVPAVDPLHFDKSIAGVGLGRTFGLEIANATPDATIGLIPCAVGGSPIDSWKPGALDNATKTHPWDDAIRRAKLALQAGTLKGILWHQGESDSKRDLAPAYAAKLADLIARLRTELAAPTAPFIAGQLGKFAESPWDEFKVQVDQTLRDLPGKVPRTAFVSAEGLQHKGDKLHFDADSYREFGKRYAAAYLKLVREPLPGTGR
ncbi:MAG: sialate O-acetylesterase [Verrucomicrobia bacterium]|nr:sialate O-acetylesterase [Verrucomicrobiota bacterium]